MKSQEPKELHAKDVVYRVEMYIQNGRLVECHVPRERRSAGWPMPCVDVQTDPENPVLYFAHLELYRPVGGMVQKLENIMPVETDNLKEVFLQWDTLEAEWIKRLESKIVMPGGQQQLPPRWNGKGR